MWDDPDQLSAKGDNWRGGKITHAGNALGENTYGMHTKLVDYQLLLLALWIRTERSI
jgi:hypothetical protein